MKVGKRRVAATGTAGAFGPFSIEEDDKTNCSFVFGDS